MPTKNARPGQLLIRVYPADGEPYEVLTRLIDHNTWDTTRARHKWPTGDEAPMTWLAFIAWAAARRTGQTSLTYEQFLADTDAVEGVDDDEGGEEAGPTQSVPGPG